MANLVLVNQGMSSLDVAELTGKNHKDVMRDIRSLLHQGVNGRNFALVDYHDKKGEVRPCYNLTPKGCLILASGYDALLREKIINRLEELEMARKEVKPQQQPKPLPQPQPQVVEDHRKSDLVFIWNGKRVISSLTLASLTGRAHRDILISLRSVSRREQMGKQMFFEQKKVKTQGCCSSTEIFVTRKGVKLWFEYTRGLPDALLDKIKRAFYVKVGYSDTRAKVGVVAEKAKDDVQTEILFEEPQPSPTPAPSTATAPTPTITMPQTPQELMQRFVAAMGALMGVNTKANDVISQINGGNK